MEARSLPLPGVICKINEIKGMTADEIDGKSVRVTGRLSSRDVAACRATLSDRRSGDQDLRVDTRLVEPFHAPSGALLQCIGELENTDSEVVLCARVVRKVEGLDLALYCKIVEQQRLYLSSKEHGQKDVAQMSLNMSQIEL